MRDSQTVAMMGCPVCKTPLALADRSGVEIDYCPQCRGVWLDRGELDKIIERSAQSAAAPRYEDRARDEYRGHKRPKSFLSELFD